MKKIMIFVFAFLFSQMALAEGTLCTKELESIPVLGNGRVKPLYVHASEMIKTLTSKSKLDNLGAVEAYCQLSFQGLIRSAPIGLTARIDHVELMKFLGLSSDQHTIEYKDLMNKSEALQMELQKATTAADDSYKRSLESLLSNIFLYKEISEGHNWVIAENSDNKINWVPLNEFVTEKRVFEQSKKTPTDPILNLLLDSKKVYDSLDKDQHYELELYYAKAGLASWTLVLTSLALCSLLLFKNFNVALLFSGLSLTVQLVLIILRVLISKRAPITNMYETVLFSGFGALLLSLVLGHLKKERWYVFMGLGYNFCTLMMLNFANGMLSATISPLVPVLRDNFWLSTHVTCIILSYGALALSWIMANTVLIKRKWGQISKKDETTISNIIYTTLKWGTTLLAAGVILGGVWADYSWGRFWGWDPKETWSLIVLCVYMAILHGRYTSWINTERFITITAGAFMSVMMAWFGVNYILASGLHSYGFSQGGAIFLFSFFAAQITLIALTQAKNKAFEI